MRWYYFLGVLILLPFFTAQATEEEKQHHQAPYFSHVSSQALKALTQFTDAIFDETSSHGKRVAAAKGITQIAFHARLEGRSYSPESNVYRFRVGLSSNKEKRKIEILTIAKALLATGVLSTHDQNLEAYVNSQQQNISSSLAKHKKYCQWLIKLGKGSNVPSLDNFQKLERLSREMVHKITFDINALYAKEEGSPSVKSINYVGQQINQYNDVPDLSPFISRLLSQEQVQKILEANAYFRKIIGKPGTDKPIQKELQELQKIPIFSLYRYVIGATNINLYQWQRTDLFQRLTPGILSMVTFPSPEGQAIKNQKLASDVTLGGFLDFGTPLVGYALTQNYDPADETLQGTISAEGSNSATIVELIVSNRNVANNLDVFHRNLQQAILQSQGTAETIDKNNLPPPLPQTMYALKIYYLMLVNKIRQIVEKATPNSEFKGVRGMNTDKNDLNWITSYNFYCLDFEDFNSLDKNIYLQNLKTAIQKSPEKYHDLDTYHLLWMIKLKMFLEKCQNGVGPKEALAKLRKTLRIGTDKGGFGIITNDPDEIVQKQLNNLEYFFTFLETFSPQTPQEEQDFIVVLKQLIPRLEYVLQQYMLINGGKGRAYNPQQFWQDLKENKEHALS